ncbi:MAG TPA: hypothetical protein VF618_18920 [Thermoanaerobaculia bacterium]
MLVTALPVMAEEEEDPVTSVLKSAGVKGGEIAAKALAGLLYDTSCVNRNNDKFTGYVCSVLGSVSGRTEDKWKQEVTNQLKEINSKVDNLTVGQREIQRSLAEMKSDLNNKFNAVAQNVVAVQHLVKIEGLWEKYQAQFDKVDEDVTRDKMLSFANEIVAEKPHTMLAELNAVLTQGIPATGGQPLVRYPLSEWRIAHGVGMVSDHKMMEAYEYAEKRFVDFRMREQKAYVMYLWAASVLETQCNLNPGQCTRPPRSTAEFKADWNRYTQQQAAAFNSAVDWLLLTYSHYRVTISGNFLPENQSLDVLQRANFLTSTMLGDGEGFWGRVISAGNAWDGSLQVACGDRPQTFMPVLKYAVPAGGGGVYAVDKQDSGPIDWWVSTRGNTVYDEAHFAPDWQNYIYYIPVAKKTPCSVYPNLPKGGVLPWVQLQRKVVEVPAKPKPILFGSFVAIQRAGGTYALVSGDWSGTTTPYFNKEGDGELVTQEEYGLIERNRPAGPRIGIYRKGRAEYSMSLKRLSSRIRVVSKINLSAGKEVRFPEDSRVRLHFHPGNCEGQFCSGLGYSSILAYDIENNDTEDKKGTLEAKASVTFVDTTNEQNAPGMKVDGSYGKTGDHKTLNVTGGQSALMQLDPQKKYRLTYGIHIDMWTQGRGTDASDFWYRALLAPATMYLTKGN